jgi:hypothetical protein
VPTQDISEARTEQHFVESTPRRHAHHDEICFDIRRDPENRAMRIAGRDTCVNAKADIGRYLAPKPFCDLCSLRLQVPHNSDGRATRQHRGMRSLQGVHESHPGADPADQVEHRSGGHRGRHRKVDG